MILFRGFNYNQIFIFIEAKDVRPSFTNSYIPTFWLVIGIVFILFGVILIVLKDYIDKLFKIKN